MAYFDWVTQQAELTSAALTVRAQLVSPNDNGQLLWDIFFPRRNVDSVVIRTLTTADVRYVSERREWNARGRFIPQDLPGAKELELVPIEDYFKLGELEVQKLRERTLGSQEAFRRTVGVTVPERTTRLVQANYRRIEVDTFTAWLTGTISARNPVTNQVATASFGFDPGRFQVAGVPWTGGPTGTAYRNFMGWMRDALDVVPGGISGVMLRTATRNAIQESAPNLLVPNSGISPTLAAVEQRIQDELGSAFRFLLNERTVDVFTGAGIATTKVKLWPAETIAVIPANGTIGYSAFAPVARVFDVSAANPEAKIDVNGVSVFLETANNGRDLTVEAQVNEMPVPEETNIWVMDAGI